MHLIQNVFFTIIFICSLVTEGHSQSLNQRLKKAKEWRYNHPDSSLMIYDSLQKEYPTNPEVYWYIGIAYDNLDKSANACLNFFIATHLEKKYNSAAIEKYNCVSWQKEWIKLIDDYREEFDTIDTSGIGLSKYKVGDKNTRMIYKGIPYVLKENGKSTEVKIKEIKWYEFGIGITLLDKSNNEIFLIDGVYESKSWKLYSLK